MSIRECRERKGLTQAQLSEILGVTAQTVWRWENGVRQPDLNALVHIGKVLECTLDEIVSSNPPCPQTKRQRGAGATMIAAST